MFNQGHIISLTAKIRAAVDASKRIDRLLERDIHGSHEICRYCGTDEEVCDVCGCCPRDHVLLLVDGLERTDDPVQSMIDFGKDVLILHESGAAFHGPMKESAWVYVGDAEMVWEVALEQRDEILEKIEEDSIELDSVWGDALDDIF